MNYEYMIDTLNESTQLEFLESAVEEFGISEGIDIGDKLESFKNAVVEFFKKIGRGIENIAKTVRDKFKNLFGKEKAKEAEEAVKDQDPKEVAEKVAKTYKQGSKDNGPAKAVNVSGMNITMKSLDKGKVAELLNAESLGIETVNKLGNIVTGIERTKNKMADVSKLKSSYLNKTKSIKDTESVYGSMFGSEQKLIQINVSMCSHIEACRSEADKYMKQSEANLKKFNSVVNSTEKSINNIKVGLFNKEEAKNFKIACSGLVSITRKTFNTIVGAFKGLAKYQSEVGSLLTRIVSVCKSSKIQGSEDIE